MDDELPGWDYDPPEGLSAMQAVVGEMVAMYLNHDPRFRDAYRAFCGDRDRDGDWHLAFLELMVLAAAQGEQLAHTRPEGSIELARELAAEEAEES